MGENLPVYAPFEVILHKTQGDCWVSFLGNVYDITNLIAEHHNEPTVKPLLAFAGKDISHWFDERTGEIRTYIHPITGVKVPYCPHGRIPDVSLQVPSTAWKAIEGLPWWKDPKYLVGRLTKMVRPIRILNMLIFKETTLNVCCEDTFLEILRRYSVFNSEASSYTWVFEERVLDMEKTMEENGIIDDREVLADLGIAKSSYIPCVRLYYNDDLKHCEDVEDTFDDLQAELEYHCEPPRLKPNIL